MLSTISEYCLARDAMVATSSASIPANGPIPTHTEKTMAQINGSIDRAMFMIARSTT